MMKEFLECGKIVAPQGLNGEVRVEPWCDPAFLLEFHTLYLDAAPIALEGGRVQKNVAILHLAGVETREDALALRGKILFIHRADAHLEPGEFFIQDLIGCRVVDADTNVMYGKIYDIRPTGANDVYYLRDDDGKERLVPAIPQVVLEKNVEEGIVTIRPLEGLFDED